MIKQNLKSYMKKVLVSVCNIVICKSLKPYIYEMSCFLYSGRYKMQTSKMNLLWDNKCFWNKNENKKKQINYTKILFKNKMQTFKYFSKLTFTFILNKLFIMNVKKIYIRTLYSQYIKSSRLSILKYRFMSISLVLNKLKENVNNALYVCKTFIVKIIKRKFCTFCLKLPMNIILYK